MSCDTENMNNNLFHMYSTMLRARPLCTRAVVNAQGRWGLAVTLNVH